MLFKTLFNLYQVEVANMGCRIRAGDQYVEVDEREVEPNTNMIHQLDWLECLAGVTKSEWHP